MSNEMTTKSVPLIRPGAEPMLAKMFRESIDRHQAEIDTAQELIEAIGEGEGPDLFPNEDLICEALNLLINDREESITRLSEGIEELEK